MRIQVQDDLLFVVSRDKKLSKKKSDIDYFSGFITGNWVLSYFKIG